MGSELFSQTNTTPAIAPSLTRIIHVPLCTADLSLLTRVRAFFLLYAFIYYITILRTGSGYVGWSARLGLEPLSFREEQNYQVLSRQVTL
jgi:hypothetical protein